MERPAKTVNAKYQMPRIEDYEPLVGPEMIGRILKKAKALAGFHVVNINSTYYGGGVAALPSSLTSLLNGLGIQSARRTKPPRLFFLPAIDPFTTKNRELPKAEMDGRLLKDHRLRNRIGRAGKETVRKKNLMPRFLEQHLDLFSSFNPIPAMSIAPPVQHGRRRGENNFACE